MQRPNEPVFQKQCYCNFYATTSMKQSSIRNHTKYRYIHIFCSKLFKPLFILRLIMLDYILLTTKSHDK